jgi:predicted small metal-binding protein
MENNKSIQLFNGVLWESQDPEIDYDQKNKSNNTNRINASIASNIVLENEKTNIIYEKLIKEEKLDEELYMKRKMIQGNSKASTNVNSNIENPFDKFWKIKKEIDLIEEDIKFYKENPEFFKEKFKYSIDKANEELEVLKKIADYMKNKENFSIIKNIVNKLGSRFSEKAVKANVLSLFNRKVLESQGNEIKNHINALQKMSEDRPDAQENIRYEIYLTPDSVKTKMFSQLVDIEKNMEIIKDVIGNYDIVSNIYKLLYILY